MRRHVQQGATRSKQVLFKVFNFPREARSTQNRPLLQCETSFNLVQFHIDFRLTTRSEVYPIPTLAAVRNRVHDVSNIDHFEDRLDAIISAYPL